MFLELLSPISSMRIMWEDIYRGLEKPVKEWLGRDNRLIFIEFSCALFSAVLYAWNFLLFGSSTLTSAPLYSVAGLKDFASFLWRGEKSRTT